MFLLPRSSLSAALKLIDEVGREVVIPFPPQRIVSLAPNITETLFALGLGPRIVGVTRYCDFPQEAGKIEKVGVELE